MEGPNGERNENTGCILEVVENEKLVWTGALKPGYRPHSHDDASKFPFLFTCVLTFTKEGTGTRYRALAIHADEGAAKTHADMGFEHGWGTALDQLVALAKRM